MEKISTFDDLIQLKNIVRRVNLGIKLKPEGLFFLDSSERKAFDEICSHNNTIYQQLPEEIEVSPEIAEFIANQITDYNDKKAAINDSIPILKIAGATISTTGAMLFPSPLHIAQAVGSVKRAISAANEHTNATSAVEKTQNVAICAVLSAYLLKENSDGKFVLKRGNWITTEERSQTGRGSLIIRTIRPENTTIDPIKKYHPNGITSDSNHFAFSSCGFEGNSEPNKYER